MTQDDNLRNHIRKTMENIENMPTKTEQIREEWKNTILFSDVSYDIDSGKEAIADWWIKKLSVLLEEQKQEMVEEIEKLRKDCIAHPMKCSNGAMTEYNRGTNEALDTVLSIIKNKETSESIKKFHEEYRDESGFNREINELI